MTGRPLTALLPLALLAGLTGCGGPDIPVVSQRDKQFRPGHLTITAGDQIRLRNDDARTHNIRVHDPQLEFDSGAQEPGEDVLLRLEQPGRYYVVCGIHPKMKLVVDVAAAGENKKGH